VWQLLPVACREQLAVAPIDGPQRAAQGDRVDARGLGVVAGRGLEFGVSVSRWPWPAMR